MSKIRFTDFSIIFKDAGLVTKVVFAAVLFFISVIVMNGTGFNPLSYPLGAIVILPFFFKDEMVIYPAEDRIERRSGFRGRKVQEIPLDDMEGITLVSEKPPGASTLSPKDYVATIHFKDDKWPDFEYGRDPVKENVVPITRLISVLIDKVVSVESGYYEKFLEVTLPPGMIADLAKPKPGEKLPLDQIGADKRFKRYIKR